ncbi:MAG: VOC family protein [Deltaproteobacteria bacterium]|nr:VOC family protein [Deltaproteobacteria bacterium]
MPRLLNLTLPAKNPGRLAKFYRYVFDLETVHQSDTSIALSDGVFNLSLISIPSQDPLGFYFMGFHVEDNESAREGLGESCARVPRLGNSPRTDVLLSDPDGNLLELAEERYGVTDQKTPFPIRHIALYTPNPQILCDFYGRVCGMEPVAHTDRSSIFVSDGYFNLALLFQRTEEKIGLNHFGFQVNSNEEIRRLAEKAGVSSGSRRPDRIPYAEYRVHDPEGNGIDISEKGWEV